jgi:hypothetical protein
MNSKECSAPLNSSLLQYISNAGSGVDEEEEFH